MNIELDGVGKFPATDSEDAYLDRLSEKHPALTPQECLCWMYLSRCLQLARSSETRISPPGHHVVAIDLLRVAEVAAYQIFGSDARAWLIALGILGSRDFGRIVYRFIDLGALDIALGDKKEDFDASSVFDGFIKPA